MKKEIFAVKAPKFYLFTTIAFMLAGLLLGYEALIFTSGNIGVKILCLLPLFILGITNSYLTLKCLFNPKIMLYYDEKNIYLNYYKKEAISFNDIKYVEVKHSRSRFSTYDYGYILIVTKNNKKY